MKLLLHGNIYFFQCAMCEWKQTWHDLLCSLFISSMFLLLSFLQNWLALSWLTTVASERCIIAEHSFTTDTVFLKIFFWKGLTLLEIMLIINSQCFLNVIFPYLTVYMLWSCYEKIGWNCAIPRLFIEYPKIVELWVPRTNAFSYMQCSN